MELSALDATRARFEAQLERILRSPEFAHSRQLSDFLKYVSRRAFDGADRLEQSDVAREVLGRGHDFNPLDDSSVRKLATLARQRLKSYYASAGGEDEVLVSLPVRSYIPEFRVRDKTEEAIRPKPSRRWLLAAAPLAVASSAGAWWFLSRQERPEEVLRIWTKRGDLMGQGEMLPGGQVIFGPTLGLVDEFTAKLHFRPDTEAQQAGILIWGDKDNYVKLARKFFGRNQFDFSWEVDGKYRDFKEALTYDADGQTGDTFWLSITKSQDQYAAWWSHDGQAWSAAGQPFTISLGSRPLRAAVFAFNGRREAASIEADFHSVAIGPTFANWPGEAATRELERMFAAEGSCMGEPRLRVDQGWLALRRSSNSSACNRLLTYRMDEPSWVIETRLDFFAQPGSLVGLIVIGDRGRLRLVRSWLNGPAICLVQDGKDLAGTEDFRGCPSIYLQLAASQGSIQARFSRDGKDWRQAGRDVSMEALGPNLRAGITVSILSDVPDSSFKGPRFQYLRRQVRPQRS